MTSTVAEQLPDADVTPVEADAAFWHSLIDERQAGAFVGLGERAMQAYRQRGGGPLFVRISARCVRYRRVDLKAWADDRLRRSTSDDGSERNAA
ncbi:MAG: DNA-binding protein [Alphaproteobacteria bacterium]